MDAESLVIAVPPEGTRAKTVYWKTGFYYIAQKADVPLILVSMDYNKKEVGVINQMNLSGDIKKDMLLIQKQYFDMQGKIAENYNTTII